MKPSLQLRLGQSLTMTPQLQQAIRLLQLSSTELQTEIQDALESNMMLELDEDEEDEEAPPAQAETAAEETVEAANVEEAAAEEGHDDIPEDLPVDTVWDDIYDGGPAIGRGPASGVDSHDFEERDAKESSLREHLLWQLNLTSTSDADWTIAAAIIDALDDDGYLSCSLEDIREVLARDMPVELQEIEAVLHLVQAMEPTGVGARDLRECLSLQLAQWPPETPWRGEALQLVGHHLDVLAAHDFGMLMRRMKLKRDELQKVVALIQSLNPRPGGQVQDYHTQYIVPDVYVRKDKGVWRVELNTDVVPHLRINSNYMGMIRRADSSADNSSLKAHLQEARWLIKSLQSRSETLLRVATCIVEHQRAFLEHGDEAMRPLVLHDVAEALGMHESTISRVTTRKYMHTPRGIFELKYFFSSHVGTDAGGACSSTAIRALIRKLITAEKPEKPLSDSKIATLLSGQGINVARRTVAKYREGMTIPPSNERKRLV
ncbi:MAG: RNA polymerase factor sigma-54 [Gammaproteobacteria bacterium]|nr:RNA polymerase factor sigma-54 [Gammaproteobacteria bacterium]